MEIDNNDSASENQMQEDQNQQPTEKYTIDYY
jgi:hypothetical protein